MVRVGTEHADLAAGRLAQRQQHVQRCRLPAPLGPRKATVCPGQSSSDSRSTARTFPYTLLTSSNDTTDVTSAAMSPGLIGSSDLIVIPPLVKKVGAGGVVGVTRKRTCLVESPQGPGHQGAGMRRTLASRPGA
jgi:hypothetical protein